MTRLKLRHVPAWKDMAGAARLVVKAQRPTPNTQLPNGKAALRETVPRSLPLSRSAIRGSCGWRVPKEIADFSDSLRYRT
jgi:hypothetical protein